MILSFIAVVIIGKTINKRVIFLDDKIVKMDKKLYNDLKYIYIAENRNNGNEYAVCLFGIEDEDNNLFIKKIKKAKTVNSTRISTFVYNCQNLLQEDKDIGVNRNLGFIHPHFTEDSCLLSDEDLISLKNEVFERKRYFMGIQCWQDENNNMIFDNSEYRSILYSIQANSIEMI